ncbi:hypothetical protein [Spongiactinospora sp. 9N601]|uniref:hypothetical protein n=1 Tax=Spongiactinospora sp. 9N601 TaxID=3375149 RepID=UPI00379372F0
MRYDAAAVPDCFVVSVVPALAWTAATPRHWYGGGQNDPSLFETIIDAWEKSRRKPRGKWTAGEHLTLARRLPGLLGFRPDRPPGIDRHRPCWRLAGLNTKPPEPLF